MRYHMRSETMLMSEQFATLWTRKRFQVKMDFSVVIKIAFRCECLLTLFTGEGPLFAMSS